MEDVSKALLIAAAMFFVILILSLLVSFHGQISDFYAQEHEHTMIEQAQEFNAKFENYHRNNIRGSDLISLMNRVIDYNAKESYFADKAYQRIQVVITLGNDAILEQFKYPTSDGTSRNQRLRSIITNTAGNDWINDRMLTDITNTTNDLINMASGVIDNVTDKKLQLLASKIESINNVNETSTEQSDIADRFYRVAVIKDILGIDIGVNDETGITNASDKTKMNCIKEMASQYHQYMYFKRAMFDCTNIQYDTETNRVVRMEFELQTNGGTVVFD